MNLLDKIIELTDEFDHYDYYELSKISKVHKMYGIIRTLNYYAKKKNSDIKEKAKELGDKIFMAGASGGACPDFSEDIIELLEIDKK